MSHTRRAFLHQAAAVAASAQSSASLSGGNSNGVELVSCPDGTQQIRLRKDGGHHVAEGEWLSPTMPLRPSSRLRWTPRWVTPQKYKKYAANPVYGPDQSGAWDTWTNGVGILRTTDRKRYRMYYCDRTNGIGFAEASVERPTEWKEHPSSPVLRPKGEPHWEGGRLNQPRLAKVTDTHWRMYYTGWGQGFWRMGLAESFDEGITWKRHSEGPLLPLGAAGSGDSEAACVPMVIRVDGQWKMWYTASGNRQNAIGIAHATSTDGIHWEKYPGGHVMPVIKSSKWETGVVSRPYVMHADGVYKMWYSMRGPTYRVGYAESPDGIHWERSPANPILDVSAKGWDEQMVEYPEIDIHNGIYRMWFCGNGFGTVGYSEGEAETKLEISVRTGNAPEPGAGWSAWSSPLRQPSGDLIRGKGKFLQVRAKLTTSNPKLSPGLAGVSVV